MNCFLFGAGEHFGIPLPPRQGDLCLAVDGGIAHMEKEGILPHALIGDFDSGLVPEGIGCPVLRHPIEKDQTDMQLAIEYGLKQGGEEFLILGGTGGRIDHTLANLACLAQLAHLGHRGYLFGENYVFLMLKNGRLSIPADLPFPLASGTASVFAYGGDANGVTISGMKYEVEDVTLLPHVPVGVSNEYTAGKDALIEVKDGMLLILLPLPR